MIPAALLCAILSGCADQQTTDTSIAGPGLQPTGPNLPRIARTDNVPFNKFFLAWSQSYTSGPIETQMFALDTRQERQWSPLYPDQAVLNFASANRGRLYINGDEPDQYCFAPSEYAGIYHAFVTAVRGADPTARVSPAGFAEPNDRCCPPGDEPCRQSMHSIGYAQQFYDAYIQRFGAPPRVDEWRFHDFGIAYAEGDVAGWWSRVDRAAAWSVAHGANMVLGGWAFHGWKGPLAGYQEHMKQAMGRLMNDSRINGAIYWSYEPWVESPRPLANSDGSLTAEGQTYANPLTDVPTGVKLVGSANGHAQLRWSNTTAAWAAEAEFWVQAPGSSSFVYKKTDRIVGPGASQTSFDVFSIGDRVKARVRYYNAYGQAGWSSFSNVVLLSSDDGDQSRTNPLFCFLQLCQ